VARRLTKEEKLSIVKGYQAGKSSTLLAKEFSCSVNTVNRTVKGMIANEEYISLKEPKKSSNTKKNNVGDQEISYTYSSEVKSNTLKNKEVEDQSYPSESEENYLSLGNEDDFCDEFIEETMSEESSITDISQGDSSFFHEISPLSSDFGFEDRKQKTSTKKLSLEILPDTLYMLVDKKVELETKLLRDLPDWSFLPEEEKKREAINLFVNQRTAKRNCARGHRVIKVPNPNALIISKPFLLSKGITRLVLDDLLIALD
tara:strand:+ start:712 stop:1488 length:777 start_codon:yes stop_codon:yes gene_type:complete